jgi:hypothetical protein
MPEHLAMSVLGMKPSLTRPTANTTGASSVPSEPRSSFPLTLGLLYDLLDVDPVLGPRELLAHARWTRGGLAPLALSLAAREGVPMGSGARDEFRRVARRGATYRELAGIVAGVPGARVVKGPSLARYYPEGIHRPSGDLDVVVPDEPALWQVLADVLDRYPGQEAVYTELPTPAGLHRLVAVSWPAEDPLLDGDYKVEVSTFAFAGEHGLVPVRAPLPADQVHADVLSLAEERFQRPFTVKDSLDLALVLTSPQAPSLPELADAAAAYHLAPELLRLCERTAEHPALAPVIPSELTHALQAPATDELRRRAALPTPHSGSLDDLDARHAAGLPLYGMQLTAPLRQGTGDHVQHHRPDDCVIARTPVADFLMVTGELVDPGRYARALAYLETREPWPTRTRIAASSH